jgi:hypothetical protein
VACHVSADVAFERDLNRENVVELRGFEPLAFLEANETNWTFVAIDRVRPARNQQVKELVALPSGERSRSYCGRN